MAALRQVLSIVFSPVEKMLNTESFQKKILEIGKLVRFLMGVSGAVRFFQIHSVTSSTGHRWQNFDEKFKICDIRDCHNKDGRPRKSQKSKKEDKKMQQQTTM